MYAHYCPNCGSSLIIEVPEANRFIVVDCDESDLTGIKAFRCCAGHMFFAAETGNEAMVLMQ
jgi:hypothetical protein